MATVTIQDKRVNISPFQYQHYEKIKNQLTKKNKHLLLHLKMLNMQPIPQMLHPSSTESENGSNLSSAVCIKLPNNLQTAFEQFRRQQIVSPKKHESNAGRRRDTRCFIIWGVIARALLSAVRFFFFFFLGRKTSAGPRVVISARDERQSSNTRSV